MTDKIKIVNVEGTHRQIDNDTKIVRYMKLETLLLLLFERRAFIPSHATLGKSDRLETEILFNLPDRWTFWENWAPKIGQRLDKFECARLDRENKMMRGSLSGASYSATGVQANFRKYVDELAVERCIWCWNESTGYYSNALWELYGKRGVAITSTVGAVKKALIEGGVECGIVSRVAYIDHEKSQVSNVLMNEEILFRPYLLKSVAYDYEREIRFVLAGSREIVRDKGGVLITFGEADFFGTKISPHLWREERLIVETIIAHHLNKSPAARFPRSSDSLWTEIYNRYNGTPFRKEDSLPPDVFSDLL